MKKLTMIVAGTLFLALVIGWHGQATAGFSVLPLDNFKCYPVTANELPNPKPALSIFDQFESDIDTVIEPSLICNPTRVDGDDVFNSVSHLVCYTIRGQAPLATQLDIAMFNMFGLQVSTALRQETLLCVPSFKTCIDNAGEPIDCPNENGSPTQ